MSDQAVMESAPAEAVEPQAVPVVAGAEEAGHSVGDEALIADELLVEEVSIDGMCGVY
jgi:mycofactocin precursor